MYFGSNWPYLCRTYVLACDFNRTPRYSASVTAAPFRRCDYKNLGISFLCNFEEQIQGQQIQPPIWGQNVLKQYMDEINTIPDYLKSVASNSNKRLYADEKASGKQIFKVSI